MINFAGISMHRCNVIFDRAIPLAWYLNTQDSQNNYSLHASADKMSIEPKNQVSKRKAIAFGQRHRRRKQEECSFFWGNPVTAAFAGVSETPLTTFTGYSKWQMSQNEDSSSPSDVGISLWSLSNHWLSAALMSLWDGTHWKWGTMVSRSWSQGLFSSFTLNCLWNKMYQTALEHRAFLKSYLEAIYFSYF